MTASTPPPEFAAVEPLALAGISTQSATTVDAPKRSRRRIFVAAGFVAVALATAAVLIALALTQESPRWWTNVDPEAPATKELAQRVENGVTTALTQVRAPTPPPLVSTPGASPAAAAASLIADPQTWKVFITTEQANAWLASRLRRWLADKSADASGHGGIGTGAATFTWPPQVEQVEVSFQTGLIYLGARVRRTGPGGQIIADERPQTLSAAVRPDLRPDGSLWISAQSIHIGRLGLPASWVLGATARVRAKVGEVSADLAAMPQTDRLLSALKGDRAVVSKAVIKLADGRRVRIIGLEPLEGKLVLTCRTEPRESDQIH